MLLEEGLDRRKTRSVCEFSSRGNGITSRSVVVEFEMTISKWCLNSSVDTGFSTLGSSLNTPIHYLGYTAADVIFPLAGYINTLLSFSLRAESLLPQKSTQDSTLVHASSQKQQCAFDPNKLPTQINSRHLLRLTVYLAAVRTAYITLSQAFWRIWEPSSRQP